MRAVHRVCAIVLVASASCSFDLVDPVPDGGDSRLSVFLDAGDWDAGKVIVSGSLRPGIDAGGEVVGVADPRLTLLGMGLAPDTAFEGGRLVLRWEDTLTAPEPRPALMELVAPRMADGLPADELALPVRRAAGDGSGRREWGVGEDLVLVLTPAPVVGEVPASASWHLHVQGWLEGGGAIHLASLDAYAMVPDTIRILAAWLPDVTIDSLQASLQYVRDYRTVRPDSTYSSSVRLAQQFAWVFIVRGP